MRFYILAFTLALSAAASASDFSASIGHENLGVHFSNDINQYKLTADLLHNYDYEDTIVNIGFGKNIPLGANTLSLGAKINLIDLKYNDTEYAMSFGGDLAIPLTSQFSIYGSAYWAPDFTSSGDLSRYIDAAVGLRFNISKPIAIDLGYRYSQVELYERYTHTPADGWYAGVGLKF